MSHLAANGRCETGRWMVPKRFPDDPYFEYDVGPCIHRFECNCPHGEDSWEPEGLDEVVEQVRRERSERATSPTATARGT